MLCVSVCNWQGGLVLCVCVTGRVDWCCVCVCNWQGV